MEIGTRAELLNALTEAAELEHGLLCQYVFAAVSLKQYADEGVSWVQAELIRDWKASVLAVARQEMAHLGTVANMLTAVGGAPHFTRLNFPQAAAYFPPEAPFVLEPFGLPALNRFIRFEEPENQARSAFAIAPTPVEYRHVGELYRSIGAGFDAIDERELFIGPAADQDDNGWSRGLHLWPVTDRASAHHAIDFVVAEGEGTPEHREHSHYRAFLDAHTALRAELERDPSFAPARPVATNPMTRPHRDAGPDAVLIGDEVTRAVSELFSVSYETTVMMLEQFYRFGPESPAQREELRQATREMMSGVIRPLGEILTQLPVGPTHPGLTAGPGFELYGDVHVSPHAANAWQVIIERLHVQGAAGLGLVADPNPHPRLQLCAENLARIGDNLHRATTGGFPDTAPSLPTPTPTPASAALPLAAQPARMVTARYVAAAGLGDARGGGGEG